MPSRISSGQMLMKLSNSSVSPLGSTIWRYNKGYQIIWSTGEEVV
jgi:hypothetical protein